MCTYPSPNPTTVNLWYVRIHFGLGEGWVYSRLDTVIDLYFPRCWLDVVMTFVVGLSTPYKKALLNLVVFMGHYLQLSHADPQVWLVELVRNVPP